MKRLTLKEKMLKMKKKTEVKKKKGNVYFSDFCATDDKNFALFNINSKFLVDKGYSDVLNFKMSEDELWMLIDRSHEIKPLIVNNETVFGEFGIVKKEYFDLLLSINPNISFYPVTEWFGKASNRLIVGLPDKTGKPIGILKTVKKEN